MPHHKIAIAPNAGGYGTHELSLDDQDISRGVRSVSLTLNPGEHPRVELEMASIEVERLEFATPDVFISDATSDALIALGWTPPASDDDPVAVVLPARPRMESVVHMYGRRYRIVGWDANGDHGDGFSSVMLRLSPASSVVPE